MINQDILQGKWHDLKGTIKQKWGELTDDDLAQINGKREELLGKLQSRYGWAKDQAEQRLKEFEKTIHTDKETAKFPPTDENEF